jgi:aryl-alcohol dehydrogenase-like predicted oxidoreductase
MNPAKKHVSRRQFIAKAAAVSALPIIAACDSATRGPLSSNVSRINPAVQAPKLLAEQMCTRTLGRTGMPVSMVGFGCGSIFKNLADGVWQPVLEKALDLGMNLIDTASAYGTEERLAAYLSSARNKLRISTKLNSRDYDGAKAEFEGCLSRLKTSYVDILLVHALSDVESLSPIEQGVWKYLSECKTSGSAKFIGFSNHYAASAPSIEFINAFSPDVAMLPMNIAAYAEIKSIVLPAASAKNIGVIAFAALRGVVTAAYPAEYHLGSVWRLYDTNSNPSVASIVVGHSSLSQVEENVCAVRKYCGMGCSTGVIDGQW